MSNPRIFLNYRREDTRGYAGRLYDRLSHRFDEDQILRDVDAISPGIDYVEQIDQLVRQCDLMLVLIGGTWLSAQGPGGQRRLDEPGDLVSLEIATALERGIPVIPVLIQGARMPDEDELPDRIRTLARRNALEMSDSHWNHDYHRLTWAIEELTKRPLPGDHSEQPASPSGEQASPSGEGAPDSSDQGVATRHKEPTAEPALPAPRKGELVAGREPEWARCGHDDCIGVRLPTKALCLAHAADQAPDTFDAELKRIRVEGTVDARGVVVTTQLLEQLLAAVPHEDGDRPAFKAAHFNWAIFQGEARFSKATFKDYAFF